jgi:hypothetical protein
MDGEGEMRYEEVIVYSIGIPNKNYNIILNSFIDQIVHIRVNSGICSIL